MAHILLQPDSKRGATVNFFGEFQKPKKVGLSDRSNMVHVVDVGDVGVEF